MSEKVKSKLEEIENASNKMQRKLEKEHVRNSQRKSFICSSKCCEDSISSAEQVQKCIENCQRPLVQWQNTAKQELERFQNRIQRCMVTCQDNAQDDVNAIGESMAKDKFESCLYKCAEDHLHILPRIEHKLRESLSG